MTMMKQVELPDGFLLRRIGMKDYEGAVQTLSGLTSVGNLTKEDYEEVLHHWSNTYLADKKTLMYNVFVIVDETAIGKVAAIGTIFLEKKLIHGGGLVGHIEDISVNPEYQGKKLGKLLIQTLTEYGLSKGCYKIILDCDVKNVGFYEKCGYSEAGIEMQIRAKM